MVISDLRGLATQQVVTQKFTCPAQEGEAALSAPAAAENFVTICRLNFTKQHVNASVHRSTLFTLLH